MIVGAPVAPPLDPPMFEGVNIMGSIQVFVQTTLPVEKIFLWKIILKKQDKRI